MMSAPAMALFDRYQGPLQQTFAEAPRPKEAALQPVPVARMGALALSQLLGVMTDIDDTLTRDGAIEPAALAALHALADAGVPVVAITGRPLGWSLPFAQAWPVHAIVAENGAVAVLREAGVLKTEFAQDAATREANARRLRQVAQRIVQAVPGAKLAQDSAGRVTDIAIDHSEFAHLPPHAVAAVVALMQGEGMNATVSSIHINGWFGSHTKYSAAQWMLQRLFGRELLPEIHRWAYVGDSTNDQLMFQHFPCSVGVANLMRFAAELQVWPAFITQAERGEGFAEFAQALLAAR
jgi:HAD superfamily hydrolase (TIGR01484 family)